MRVEDADGAGLLGGGGRCGGGGAAAGQRAGNGFLEKNYFVTLFSKCHDRTFPRNLTEPNRLRVDKCVSDNKSLLGSPD